jgi:hypothetical protein
MDNIDDEFKREEAADSPTQGASKLGSTANSGAAFAGVCSITAPCRHSRRLLIELCLSPCFRGISIRLHLQSRIQAWKVK